MRAPVLLFGCVAAWVGGSVCVAASSVCLCSTLAGEVEEPQRTFPAAMHGALVLVVLGYLLPLMAGQRGGDRREAGARGRGGEHGCVSHRVRQGDMEDEKCDRRFVGAEFIVLMGAMTSSHSILHLPAGTGALPFDETGWDDGYLAVVARKIGGGWLAWWVAAAAALSNMGAFEAEMSR